MIRSTLVLAAALSMATLPGCSKPAKVHADPSVLLADPVAPRSVPVFDGKTGARVPWKDFIGAAAGADAVVVGENHGHPLGLATAAALWSDVLDRTDHAALAMEFFERDEQSRLDDYLSGISDETAFRKRTGRNEGSYPPGHRAMVEAAKAHHRPVIAANAPRPYVHAAKVDGYDKLATLTPEQRRLFRVPDSLPGPESHYRKEFEKIMTPNPSHPDPKKPAPEVDHQKDIDAAFRSQSMWNWTMAESVARGCEAGNAPVVQVVGRFHSDFDGGLVQALRSLRPGARVVTVSFIDRPGFSLQQEDKDRADFVIYVGPEPEE